MRSSKQRPNRPLTTATAAREVAIGALAWLASDPERIGPFLAESGMAPTDLRGAVGSPAFQVAILDHLINHQDLLLDHARGAGLDPGHVVAAREILANAPPERNRDRG